MRAGCDVHATDKLGRTGRDLARLGAAHGWSDGLNASSAGLGQTATQTARPALWLSIPTGGLRLGRDSSQHCATRVRQADRFLANPLGPSGQIAAQRRPAEYTALLGRRPRPPGRSSTPSVSHGESVLVRRLCMGAQGA